MQGPPLVLVHGGFSSHITNCQSISLAIPTARRWPSNDDQAHEGMTTAPQQYADAVIAFLNN